MVSRKVLVCISCGAVFLPLVATSTAGAVAVFIFKKPAAAVTFKRVTEKELVEIENFGTAGTPTIKEVQAPTNLNAEGKQYIGVSTFGTCNAPVGAAGKCTMEVEYERERPSEKSIAEFWLSVEPPVGCPNMSKEFKA